MTEDIRDSTPMFSRSRWRITFNSLVSSTISDISRRTFAVVASSTPISACLQIFPASERLRRRSDLSGLSQINPLIVTILVRTLSNLFCSPLDSLHSVSSLVVTCNCERNWSLIMINILSNYNISKGIHVLYMYNNWRKRTNVGPSCFSFGHEHSLEHLEGRIEWLRRELPVLSGQFTEVSTDVYQATLDF